MEEVLPNTHSMNQARLIGMHRVGQWSRPTHNVRFMTRHNLIALMVNMGLKSGQDRVSTGYGTTPAESYGLH